MPDREDYCSASEYVCKFLNCSAFAVDESEIRDLIARDLRIVDASTASAFVEETMKNYRQ